MTIATTFPPFPVILGKISKYKDSVLTFSKTACCHLAISGMQALHPCLVHIFHSTEEIIIFLGNRRLNYSYGKIFP